MIGVAALVVAIVALILGMILPQAMISPQAPKPVIATSVNSTTATIGGSCTNYDAVTIAAPSSGRIVVLSMVQLSINHFSGQGDRVFVSVATSPSTCYGFTGPPYLSDPRAWVDELGSNWVSANYMRSANVQGVFNVTASGTYAYYVNGFMQVGADALDEFRASSTIATFYPS